MSPPAPRTEGVLLSSCSDSLSSHNSHGRGPLGSAPDPYLDLWYRLCLQWACMDASVYGTKQLRNNHALPLHCKQSFTLLIMAIVQWHCSPWELVGVHIETEVFKSDHATCRLQYRCILKPWCQVEKSRHRRHILYDPSYTKSPELTDPWDKMQICCHPGPEEVGMGTDCLIEFLLWVLEIF